MARYNAMSQGVVKRWFPWFVFLLIPSMHSFPEPRSDVIRLMLSGTLEIDILFSIYIKQWDKFKLDYSEQD